MNGTASKNLLALAFVLLGSIVSSRASQTAPTDFMRSTGKIYVVVAVIAVVFIGIVLFLIFLERRLTKLENQIHDNEPGQNH